MNSAHAPHDVYSAVADPTRRAILDLLAQGPRPVGDIVSRFAISQPAVSQHLRVLRESDLVIPRAEGRFRIYELHADPLRHIADWTRHFERFWEAKHDALAIYLARKAREESR